LIISKLTIQQCLCEMRHFVSTYLFRSLSSIHIRRVKKSDAAQLLHLFATLENETVYMLFNPEEKRINNLFESSDSNVMFVAEHNQQLVGFIRGVHEASNQYSSSLHIVVGVIKAAWKQGIGNALMKTLEQWGRTKDYRYLELSVMDINQAALAFYDKYGFSRDNIAANPILIEDRFVHEIQMSKCLGASK